jgi:hypothetical protein
MKRHYNCTGQQNIFPVPGQKSVRREPTSRESKKAIIGSSNINPKIRIKRRHKFMQAVGSTQHRNLSASYEREKLIMTGQLNIRKNIAPTKKLTVLTETNGRTNRFSLRLIRNANNFNAF